jgi:soluble lytic murein transglycosylase-like protein
MKRGAKLGAMVLALLLAAAAFAADTPVVAPASATPAVYLAVLSNGFSIRHIRREVRDGGITRLYTSADDFVDVPSEQISSIEEAPPTVRAAAPAVVTPPAVPQLIDSASLKHSVDADFIRSVIRAESGFNSKAVSPKGAQGLMQLMPDTAQKLGVSNSFEPGPNIDAGTRYLRELLVQYHGDVARALAAYNAGPQRVAQYGGVPPYRETRAYVRRVINDYNRAKKSSQKPHAVASTATKKPPASAAVTP